MKRLFIKKPEEIKQQILEYLHSSEELKFAHKLHGILLLLENETTNCSEVSRIFGNTPQTLTGWVHKLNQGEGGNIEALRGKVKPGRNTRLSKDQIQNIKYVLKKKPTRYGIDSPTWDGKTLATYLTKKYGVHLKIRMCQRWLQKLKKAEDSSNYNPPE
ncbi:helix-turn-helix domain-containing protein [Flavitalea flava]